MKELKTVLKSLGIQASETEVRNVFKEMDTDGKKYRGVKRNGEIRLIYVNLCKKM